ncbi:hypothetical protein CRG98_018103 [Punica granatum]|uniref:Uncharacterized protein n=1 Tax=Punica granatum TaxID=22663 RepID=A0A2I0JYV6_PUNGR|nr:hypothetical protein CRG98_018103 [Punica granatum]
MPPLRLLLPLRLCHFSGWSSAQLRPFLCSTSGRALPQIRPSVCLPQIRPLLRPSSFQKSEVGHGASIPRSRTSLDPPCPTSSTGLWIVLVSKLLLSGIRGKER